MQSRGPIDEITGRSLVSRVHVDSDGGGGGGGAMLHAARRISMMNGCELSRMGARELGSRKRKEEAKKKGRKEEERRNEPSAIDGLHRNCIECIRASYPRRVALQWVQQRPQRSCSNIVFRRGEYRDYGDYGGGTPCGHERDRLIPVLSCPGINPSCFAREALSLLNSPSNLRE